MFLHCLSHMGIQKQPVRLHNYMFLVRGDGTPYEILYSLVGGNAVLYPISVMLLFVLYISAFYAVFYFARKRVAKKLNEEKEPVMAISD